MVIVVEQTHPLADNVPFITRKEKALTGLLGTLQVGIRTEGESPNE